MRLSASRRALSITLIAVTIGTFGIGAGAAQTPNSRIDEALQNISTLVRPGKVGYATFWDGNKYIQCRRLLSRELRCEAAGTVMQSSLASVLRGDRLVALTTLGWTLDPSFGNYARTFPTDMPTAQVADHILRTLTQVYDVNEADVEIDSHWVADIPCPPRHGPSQNLAGMVSDAPSMRATAVTACFYKSTEKTPQIAKSATDLIILYGATAAAEIQRLRINASRRVYVVFDAGIGYVQCAPDSPPPAIYCEAQSAESWPALASVLTPERVSKLKSAGYADPGRAPNYWKVYPASQFNNVAIANEALTILHDVYGYNGAAELKIRTE